MRLTKDDKSALFLTSAFALAASFVWWLLLMRG